MSTGSTGTGESHQLDQKIKEIKEVLARDISNDDRQSLKRMLMEAMDEKKMFPRVTPKRIVVLGGERYHRLVEGGGTVLRKMFSDERI